MAKRRISKFLAWRVVTPKRKSAFPISPGRKTQIEKCVASCSSSALCYCVWTTLQFIKFQMMVSSNLGFSSFLSKAYENIKCNSKAYGNIKLYMVS